MLTKKTKSKLEEARVISEMKHIKHGLSMIEWKKNSYIGTQSRSWLIGKVILLMNENENTTRKTKD
jgi:hypothetical protein